MEKSEIGSTLVGLWHDLQQPEVLWQVAALTVCVAVAWLAARVFRRPASGEGVWRIGRSGLNRILFPLLALGLLSLARIFLRQWHHVHLLDVAVPLFGSFVIIRVVVFALRQAFSPSGWLATFERVVALLVWGAVAMHITGLLPELVGALDGVTFAVGKQKLTLWLVLQGVATVLATLLLALWLGGVIEARLNAAAGLDGNLKLVFARLARGLLIVLAVLLSLPLVGIDLTALSVFGGALGVGIGLGLQKIAASYVSGFVILLDRSIRIGNVIALDKHAGEVTKITTRYTVLRSPTGVEAIIPNEVLIGSVVLNETYTDTRIRLAAAVQVAYGSDLEAAMRVLVEAARRQPRVLAEPEPKAYVVRFADSGIELELGYWIADPEQGSLNIKSDINLGIWRAFRAAGIEIPFPRREVRLVGEVPAPGRP